MNKTTTPLVPILIALVVGILSASKWQFNIYLVFLVCYTISCIFLYIYYRSLRSWIILISFVICGNLITSHRESTHTFELPFFIEESRIWLDQRIDSLFTTQESNGLIKALLLGDKTEITNQERQLFIESGTIHLMAVSGLHTGAIFFLLFSLLRFLHIKRIITYSIVITAVWFYAALTGLSPSTIRAALILTFISGAYMMQIIHHPVNILALSAIISLLFFPSLIYSISFQLSYAAYLGIILIMPLIRRSPFKNKWWYRYILLSSFISLAAQLFTTPLLLYHFQHLPLLGIVSNIAAIPITTFILYGSCFVLTLPCYLTYPLIFILDYLIKLLYFIITSIATLGIGYAITTTPTITQIVSLYLPIISFVYYLYQPSKKKFSLYFVSLIPLCITLYTYNSHQEHASFHFFNSGKQPTILFQNNKYVQSFPYHPTNQKVCTYISINKLKLIETNDIYITPSITLKKNQITFNNHQYSIIMDKHQSYTGSETLITTSQFSPYDLIDSSTPSELKQVIILITKYKTNLFIWQQWSKEQNINISYIDHNLISNLVLK